MNTHKNVVIKKGCHCRTYLSAIYNARRCQIKEISLLNRYVEDPRQRHSGMTTNFTTAHGFTLIELLVVILIIGILAAVALPQYQLAVAKARVARLKPIWNALSKAQQVYYVQNGAYANRLDILDIELPSAGTLSADGRKMTYNEMTCYLSGRNNSLFCKDTNLDNLKLEWFFESNTLICWATDTPKFERLCQSLAGTSEKCMRGSSTYGNGYCIYQ